MDIVERTVGRQSHPIFGLRSVRGNWPNQQAAVALIHSCICVLPSWPFNSSTVNTKKKRQSPDFPADSIKDSVSVSGFLGTNQASNALFDHTMALTQRHTLLTNWWGIQLGFGGDEMIFANIEFGVLTESLFFVLHGD